MWLRAGFTHIPHRGARARAFWRVTAIGATVVVSLDHQPLLNAIGFRGTQFIRDVLTPFTKVVAAVLRR